MLCTDVIVVRCRNHMEHTNTICGQNEQLFNVKTGGTYIYHCGLQS